MQNKKPEEYLYNKLYRDIIFGYSCLKYKEKEVYIKHISQNDFGHLEDYEDKYVSYAKKKGLVSEQEKLKELFTQDLWSPAKEKFIHDAKERIHDLEVTVSKLIVAAQQRKVRKDIEKLQKDLSKTVSERAELLGLTSEAYASKKTNLEILRWTLFKDEELKELLFSQTEFDYLDDSDLNTLLLQNNEIINKFNSINLKKIAASGFFLNAFLISDANVFSFYGKPVVSLTNYQIDVFNHGMRYKSVLEKGKSPPGVLQDIGQIVDWYENQLSGKTMDYEETKQQASTIVGASAEEMQAEMEQAKGRKGEKVTTLQQEVKKLQKESGEKKKSLSMQDLMKIHGEI